MRGTFPYKTEPYLHQRQALAHGAKRPYAGIFMEPGTGKSKVLLDTAAFLFLTGGAQGKIDGLLIIAPNGMHYEWSRVQLPTHMSDSVQWEVFEWESSKASNKSFVARWAEFMDTPSSKLAVFAINVEALITANGKSAVRSFLKKRKVLMAIDESTDIKTPGSKRTKAIKALGRLARYRRILSGFPDPESPIDLYAQLSFLSPHIVGSSVAAFKSEYAEYEQVYFRGPQHKPVPMLRGYRNLDKLRKIVNEHCFRVTKDVLNLPPKTYSNRYFDMSTHQARMYQELLEDWYTEFPDGEAVSVDLTIVRDMRLQQIASGYVPTDDPEKEEPIRVIPGPTPRLDTLMDILERTQGKVIIWTRYILDADLIMSALNQRHPGRAVRYDGKVSGEERAENKKRFQEGHAQYFVGSPKAGGRGLTLTAAQTAVYYSHYWALEPRLQSEDRIHRIGTTGTVLYVSMIARDTVDEKIVERRWEKEKLGRMVLGDRR